MKQLLIDKKVFFQGQIIEEEKGIMAGVPISAFLSNVFLNDIDHFYAEKTSYMLDTLMILFYFVRVKNSMIMLLH